MRKLFILLFFSASSLLMAQNTNPIQEAMANYDYETALTLIDKETPTVPLLYQKGKALKSLGNNREALQVYEEVVMQVIIKKQTGIKILSKGSGPESG